MDYKGKNNWQEQMWPAQIPGPVVMPCMTHPKPSATCSVSVPALFPVPTLPLLAFRSMHGNVA